MITKEKILNAEDITGIIRRYGSDELSSINILLNEDEVFCFDCDSRSWHEWNSDSYWDLCESEVMLEVMKPLSPFEAAELLEKMNAFCQM